MSLNLNSWDVVWTNQVGSRKLASDKKVASPIRSLVNPRDLQLECASLA